MIIALITILFRLNCFSLYSTTITQSLDESILILTPVMDATYFNDIMFDMESSFICISRRGRFKGKIFVKLFKPTLLCTTSTSFLVQLQTNHNILRLTYVQKNPVDGNYLSASDCVKLARNCIRPFAFLPFPL